ncbi:type IV pilus assembly protein FimV [Thiothrix eikelboomii]|uniref:type IV pilus assembly protein FimV n=1 Tax=Thiothrix eikelboomii TaxID=92487 RepID=UPI003BAF980A
MVKKQAIGLMLVMAGTYPSLSSALSLGEIQLNSQANQPFKARIELLQATEQELAKLQVHLAPPSLFAQAQLARPPFMDSLRFARSMKDGKNYLLISSSQAVTESEFNLLLELTSPKGHLLKRYAVALAEPSLDLANVAQAPLQQQVPSVPTEFEPLDSVTLVENTLEPVLATRPNKNPQRSRSKPIKLRAPKVAIALPELAFKYRYRVRKAESIFTIAERLNLSALTLDEKVLALYARNPHAFVEGDLHQLKRGAVLKTPAVVRQSRQGRVAEPTPMPVQVAIVPKSSSPVLKPQALALPLKLTDLQERLDQAQNLLATKVHENTELKALIQAKNHLLTRREQELAALQLAKAQAPIGEVSGAAGPTGMARPALMEAAPAIPKLENTWQGVFTSPLVWKMTALSSLFLVLVALWQKRRSDEQFMQLSVQNAILLPDAYVDEADELCDLDFLWAEDELALAHEQLDNLRQSMANLRETSQRLQAYLQPEPMSAAI